jgi:hypothetical protein
MSAINEQLVNNWWAEDDTPVQANSHVSYRVDARSALLTMCLYWLLSTSVLKNERNRPFSIVFIYNFLKAYASNFDFLQ